MTKSQGLAIIIGCLGLDLHYFWMQMPDTLEPVDDHLDMFLLVPTTLAPLVWHSLHAMLR